jgi:hypothetical protein
VFLLERNYDGSAPSACFHSSKNISKTATHSNKNIQPKNHKRNMCMTAINVIKLAAIAVTLKAELVHQKMAS